VRRSTHQWGLSSGDTRARAALRQVAPSVAAKHWTTTDQTCRPTHLGWGGPEGQTGRALHLGWREEEAGSGHGESRGRCRTASRGAEPGDEEDGGFGDEKQLPIMTAQYRG
jgi:hypothetical protein